MKKTSFEKIHTIRLRAVVRVNFQNHVHISKSRNKYCEIGFNNSEDENVLSQKSSKIEFEFQIKKI